MAGRQEQWVKCCDWLRRVGFISSDHHLTAYEAKLSDLCHFLRDGVMLCKLLYLIDEHSIDLRSINMRPQRAQFLCLKNIGIFLQTCEKKFDIHRDDLFEPQMLFEFSDFQRVLHTLSKLSNSPKAQHLHVIGFPEESEDGEEIYETLVKDLANCLAGDSSSRSMQTQEATDDYLFKGNTIYVELKLCSANRQQDAAVPWQDTTPDLTKKRDLCLQELVETEHNYVEALNMLCSKFRRPLKRILREEQLGKIFGKIPELSRIHKTLHEGLKAAQDNLGNKTVSMVFLENQEKLIVYGEYCANLTTAQQELEDLMNNNEEARNHIQECQHEVSDNRHQLREYLVVPLQRILKYHLLLQELMRHTQSSHSDKESLKQAYEGMRDLAEYINEVKRDNEMLQIIKDLQMSILEMPNEINNWEDLGKLRHDGETRIECHPDHNRKRYVFVFDKVMVICSKQTRDEKYIYKDCVKLENCRVEDSNVVSQGGNTKWRQNSFYLVVGDNRKAYTIITKDSDSKDKWMKIINEAIEYLNPTKNQETGHSFTVTTFIEPNTRCKICRKLLKGTIFQGYRCPKCDMIVHRGCLNGAEHCGRLLPESLQPSPHLSPSSMYPGYGHLMLNEHPWWVERMTREEATHLLIPLTEGTFLIRWSDRLDKLVLSLKVTGEVKHMRVLRHEDTNHFYLSEAHYFHPLEALINYYRNNPLSECFTGLNSYLYRPLYDIAIARFSYQGTGVNHLSLEEGDRVVVISREGEDRGWWKGRIGSRVGYFPREYVTIQNDVFDRR